MSNYKKFDPSIIRSRIKEGAYPSLVGANRAIGKTQGLSDEERLSLKKVAAKHFGADAPVAAAAPKAAKKAAKKAGKKSSKKAAKKTAKKASKRAPKPARGAKAAPEASTETDPAPEVTEAVAPAVKKTRAKRGSKAQVQASEQLELPHMVSKPAPLSEESGPVATARLMGSVIGSCDQMVKSINMTNSLLPKEVAEAGNVAAVRVMTRAVDVLDQDVVGPLHKSATTAAKAATPPKPRTPPKRTTAAKPEQPAEQTSEEEDVAHMPLESDLTEDEQELLNVARETQPAALSAAGLNRVPKGLGGSGS